MTTITPKQKRVLDALTEAAQPVSAYFLLDQLRGDGFKAPPQIYRALDKLVNLGLAHRVDSLNAFVACTGDHADHCHQLSAFVICSECGQTVEVSAETISRDVAAMAEAQRFSLASAKIELLGRCENCQST